MAAITDLKLCKTIQIELGRTWNDSLASAKPVTGMLDALTSSQNTMGMSKTPLQNAVMGGQRVTGNTATGRRVVVRGWNADCSPCVDAAFDPCNWTAGTAITQNSYEFVVNQTTCPSKRSLAISDVLSMCDSQNDYLAQMVREMANECLTSLNNKLVTTIAPLMGAYGSGTSSITTPTTLNLINKQTLNFIEYTKIQKEYIDKGYSGTPIAVGGNQIFFINALKGNLGTNQEGLNLGNIPMPSMFYDRAVDAVTNNVLFTWMPKTFQLLEWYQNELTPYTGAEVTYQGVKYATEEQRTLLVDGIKFDFYTKFNHCGTIDLAMIKHFDVAPMPVEVACANKYPSHQYLIGCGDVSC